MYEQCNAENSGSFWNTQEDVKSDSPIGMKGMKPDTATIRIEDRMGQEVVQVNDNTAEQYQHSFKPIALITQYPDDNRD